MRARIGSVATCSIVSAALGAALFACFDLFHSTADIRSACELDGQAPPCVEAGADARPPPEDSGPPDAAGQDFCAWSSQEARLHAQHACAWLGACETPMGRNAFGSCMFQALLAYDCQANPNHRVQGKAHALWDCLSQMKKTCRDVDACLFPLAPQRCSGTGNYTACGSSGGAETSNADVRFECVDGGGSPDSSARGENCALWGQTCAAGGATAACVGGGGLGCTTRGCGGVPRTQLLWCSDGGDIGIDCADNGGQGCQLFQDTSSLQWVACLADSDAGACAPNASASCANGIARSCPSGVLESIDCAAILQTDAGCAAGRLAPPFDWTSPCIVSPPQCTESCTDGGLLGCARGAAFSLLDCASEGLGACHMVSTDTSSMQHPACAPPSP